MSAPRIDLVYFRGCPHVDTAREAIRTALRGMPAVSGWREWDRDDPATPETLRVHGSPTVLVDGCDVTPAVEDGACCRVYATKDGVGGAPSPDAIRSALESAYAKQRTGEGT